MAEKWHQTGNWRQTFENFGVGKSGVRAVPHKDLTIGLDDKLDAVVVAENEAVVARLLANDAEILTRDKLRLDVVLSRLVDSSHRAVNR